MVLQLLMLFKKFQMSLKCERHKPNKYGQIQVVNLTVDKKNHDYKIRMKKFSQHTMKGNLLLLKDLSDPYKIRSINICLQYQKPY